MVFFTISNSSGYFGQKEAGAKCDEKCESISTFLIGEIEALSFGSACFLPSFAGRGHCLCYFRPDGTREKQRNSEEILTLYLKGYPLFSVVLLPILPLNLDWIPGPERENEGRRIVKNRL